jgi:lipid II:glycine glycyltransferase (peptidoglycan interpeptide bridge formation enzyme)
MISNLSKEAWDAKVIELGGSILQSWDWGEFQKSLDQKIYRFSGNDFACLGVEISLPMNKKYVYCPRGPLGNIEAALLDLKNLAADRSEIFCRLEPLNPVDLPAALKDIQPKDNWMLTINKSEETLLIGMKPKTRYNINLAQRKGVEVREGGKTELLDFFQLMLETAKRNQFKLHPQNYYFQMWDHLSPQNLKLLLAYSKDQLLAGLLLTTFGETATYLHGGSSEKMKEAMAPYVLHWEAIKLSRKQGMKNYDFGGIAPNDQPKHSWAGISRFKKSFGGFEVIYPGSFDLVFSPIWYNVYKQGRKLRKLIPNEL